MNYRILIILLITICFNFSCKKEKNNQGTIEFDFDGVHYSFIPKSAGIYEELGVKYFEIVSPLANFYWGIFLADTSLPGSSLLPPKEYPDTCQGCRLIILYYDASCTYDNQDDPGNYARLHITSCTGDPPVINGTFEAKYVQGRWDTSCFREKLITNGKITNVIYD